MEILKRLERMGMTRPDTRAALEAEEVVREAAPPFLLNHSIRCHYYAVALAARDGIPYDAELLYVAALFHDVGLVTSYDLGGCFEEDGAVAGAAFAESRGWRGRSSEAVAEAIRLHMALSVEVADGPEAFLLWHSTGLDVRGHRLGDLDPDVVSAVVAAYPRLDFKEAFAALIEQQAARKPHCLAAEWVARGMREQIAAAPFEE